MRKRQFSCTLLFWYNICNLSDDVIKSSANGRLLFLSQFVDSETTKYRQNPRKKNRKFSRGGGKQGTATIPSTRLLHLTPCTLTSYSGSINI